MLRVYAYTKGDRSVGIAPHQTQIILDIDGFDGTEEREAFREGVSKLIGDLYQEKCRVVFGDEPFDD